MWDSSLEAVVVVIIGGCVEVEVVVVWRVVVDVVEVGVVVVM